MSFTYNAVSDVVNKVSSTSLQALKAIVLENTQSATITSDVAATTRTGSRNFKNSFNVVSKPENSFILGSGIYKDKEVNGED